MKDFCLEENQADADPAMIGEILGAAGVNIEGLCFAAFGERCVIHFVVEDDVTAMRALEGAGVNIKEISQVYVLHKDRKHVTGKPGSFGDICRTLSDHGIKIRFGYPAENNRFVFGVDDVEKTRELLE